MKKIITLVLLSTIINYCTAQNSQINNKVDDYFTTTTSETQNEQTALQTTCDSVHGGFSTYSTHQGNMFDLVALKQVTITGFDADPNGTTDYEIYYRPGSCVGHETSPGWYSGGTATGVVSQGFGTPIPIPLNVTMNAGQTYGWYITSSTSVTLNYCQGPNLGITLYADSNLDIKVSIR